MFLPTHNTRYSMQIPISEKFIWKKRNTFLYSILMMMYWRLTLFLIVLGWIAMETVAFRFIGTPHRCADGTRSITMRDASTASIFFKIGDKVQVIRDVLHRPNSLPEFSSMGFQGVVCDVWEKCEVDPHCCCAELAFDAPVQVRFIGNNYDPLVDSWNAHFSLDEIELVEKKG